MLRYSFEGVKVLGVEGKGRAGGGGGDDEKPGGGGRRILNRAYLSVCK